MRRHEEEMKDQKTEPERQLWLVVLPIRLSMARAEPAEAEWCVDVVYSGCTCKLLRIRLEMLVASR